MTAPACGDGRDLIGHGAVPPEVVWPGGAALALNIALNYEEGSERTMPGDGVNESLGEIGRPVAAPARDLATESVYEYGSRAGVFRILRMMDEYAMPLTLFAAAVALERNPEVCAWIRRAGHDVCGHGHRWSEDWTVDREEEAARITAAVDSITRTCGRRPAGWYNRWMPSEHTRELLVAEGGFAYDSNAYNDDLPYWTRVAGRSHLVVPYTLTYNDSRYAAHGLTPAGFVDTCVRGIDELAREAGHRPKMMTIGLHARFTGQAARASALREILDHVAARGDVWVARREDIAATWKAQHPPPS
ncbi:polysaccharide deacetylase [Streptomyces sulfonofaciens]|uniref:Polysaccharide deacetylase n=1 Tax=Streptomyces sulfonofaciens TaxID=68272 RepID=A0A919L0W1_9ACTN|nr:polysaccharide deacetylase family protein [Streptomyces sulfonofaciens]GHH79359.1 polysaccharide deacetylase [Streptomyces sulfonofaciens]